MADATQTTQKLKQQWLPLV